MKTIIKIARLELNNLFYSPIAWFLIIVFLEQNGFSYMAHIETILRDQELDVSHKALSSLTDRIYGLPLGAFGSTLSSLYLYLPLLTMGLMSREISSGTVKLLYSSPLKIREIIFGKFLAMLVYNAMLIVVLLIFVIAGYFNIDHADVGQLFSALLGIYLLLCAYAAIGLFVSCLTSYQVVAALSTFVVFACLTYIGTIGQGIDIVRDITYPLSISNRAAKMIVGLISTQDVVYFLFIIYLFLGLSILKLKAERESNSRFVNFRRFTFLILTTLIIGYISSRPGLIIYWDCTANKTQTLTPNTQKVVKKLKDSQLEITAYTNILDDTYYFGAPDQRNQYLDRWQQYLRFDGNIKFKYVYYYDSVANPDLYKQYPGKSLRYIAESKARLWKTSIANYKSPDEISKIIDLSGEKNRLVMQLTYKGRSTFLRLYDDQFVVPLEQEIASGLKRLTVKAPKIGFLTNELERSIDKFGDRSYKSLTNDRTFRYSLINQGFDVETLSLKNQNIPADVTTLVIADPKIEFDPAILNKIQKYIAGGGNLLIAGEPGKQTILNQVINPLGIQLMDGSIVQKSKDFAPDLVLANLTPFSASFSKTLQQNLADSVRVSMPGVTALSYQSNGLFQVKPLLTTGGNSWKIKGDLNADSADMQYTPSNGDEKRSFATAISLTRHINGKEQRIVVTGDADFLDNNELHRHADVPTDNYYFSTALFGWLSYGEFPIDTSRPKSKDNKLNVTDEKLTVLKYLFYGILPGIVLAIGSILLIRRKRR